MDVGGGGWKIKNLPGEAFEGEVIVFFFFSVDEKYWNPSDQEIYKLFLFLGWDTRNLWLISSVVKNFVKKNWEKLGKLLLISERKSRKIKRNLEKMG